MMIGSWYLLVPVLLPILSGLAVFFVRPFEEKRQRCNAASELYIGALAFLCQILSSSKLFFFLGNQLNQFFLGE